MPPLFVLVKGAVLVRFFKSKCLFDTGFCFSLPLLNDGFAFGRGCVGFPGVLLSAAEGSQPALKECHRLDPSLLRHR